MMKLSSHNRKNVPLICIAAAHGSLECIKYLVKNGANVNLKDGSGV